MRHHIIRRDRRLAFIILGITLTLFLTIFSVLLFDTRSDAKDESYLYMSVRIEEGDTLDGLASRYLSVSGVPRHSDYVKEISRVNRLSSDVIFAGCYLVIPVLDTGEVMASNI